MKSLFRWIFVDLLGLRGVLMVLVLVVLGVPSVLFWLQNSETRVDLVLRLQPKMGWYLVQDAPVPTLIGFSLVVGLLLASLYFSVLQLQKGRQIRLLRRQVMALQGELDLARQAAERRAAAAAEAERVESGAERDPEPSTVADDSEPSATNTGNFDDLI